MTTPTREQVIAAPPESYSAEDRAFYEFWYAHMKDNMMQPPLNTVHHSVARLIYTAGRDQGLREAKEVCEREAEGFGGVAAGPFATDFGKHTHNAMAAGAKNCAAAIEQLRGK